MYLAQIDDKTLLSPFYTNQLNELSIGKKVSRDQKERLDSAIKSAILIGQEKKDIYSVSNLDFYFITLLLEKCKAILVNKDANDTFDKSFYSKLLHTISI